jgi:hypothetical protein
LVRAERHTGYKRLLDRMAVGVLAALDLADTDPGAVAGSWLASMHRLPKRSVVGRKHGSAHGVAEAWARAPRT